MCVSNTLDMPLQDKRIWYKFRCEAIKITFDLCVMKNSFPWYHLLHSLTPLPLISPFSSITRFMCLPLSGTGLAKVTNDLILFNLSVAQFSSLLIFITPLSYPEFSLDNPLPSQWFLPCKYWTAQILCLVSSLSTHYWWVNTLILMVLATNYLLKFIYPSRSLELTFHPPLISIPKYHTGSL